MTQEPPSSPQIEERMSDRYKIGLGLAGLGLIGLSVIGMIFGRAYNFDAGKVEQASKLKPCYATQTKFDDLATCMSTWRAGIVMGCAGLLDAQQELMGVKIQHYSWHGENGGYVSATFHNNSLITKTAYHL